MNNFKNKLNNNKIDGNKIIFSENSLFLGIKNILAGKAKKEIIDFIINNICINYINNNDINNINNNINNINEENNNYNYYLIKSPKIIYMLLLSLFEIKDDESLLFLLKKIEQFINIFEINIKLLLNFDFISIFIKILLQNENNEIINKIKLILNKICKYLDEKLLINYILKVYVNLYDILINEEKNINNNKRDIIIDLFNIIKNGLIISKKSNNNNKNYLSISNNKLSNPYIYNLFYISGLSKKGKIINYNISMRILDNNNNIINNFHLATFINAITLSTLSFVLVNENQLIISLSSNKKDKKIIKTFNNINNYLKKDNNFHNISIILNFELSIINIIIDSIEIKDEDNNIIIFDNDFSLELFDIMIGYEINGQKDDKKLINTSIIDISNILILNYDNEEDIKIINKKKNNQKEYSILDNYIIEKNKFMGEIISAEFYLRNNNINFIKLYNIKTLSKYLYDNYLNDKNNKLSNKYISNMKYKNPFINKNNIINIFMISYNYNIEEYYSLNNIFVENNINKNVIKSLISKNFDLLLSTYNYFFIDFLIGFLFLFEKKRKTILIKKNKNNNNNDDIIINDNNINNNNKEIINKNIDNNKILEGDFINEIIIIIFEIIFELQNKKIINYFLYENDIFTIKIKHFFERNIYLINNKQFIEKLFSILKMTKLSDLLEADNNIVQEYLLNIITKIFLNLIIFKKLNNEIKNIIILKIDSIIKIITFKNNNNINNIIYQLLINLYNIIIFCELSTDIINNDNQTQIDIIFKIIQKIYIIFKEDKFFVLENKSTYYQKINEINEDIINLSSEYNDNLNSHNIHQFIEQNINILSDNFLENNLIKKQIEKLSYFIKQININDNNNKKRDNSSFDFMGNNNDNINLNNLNNLNIENENKKAFNKKCSFCYYLNIYFKIYFNFIYDDIKYDKYYNKFYINLFLNFKEFRNIIHKDNNKYVWFLSSKETSNRIQNKFFLKKNDIKSDKLIRIRGNKSVEYNIYSYNYDKDKYIEIIKNLHKLFILDNISADSYFITQINDDINQNQNNISDNIINCLYVKRIHKTLSLFILTNEYILILYNLFINLNNRINVVKKDPDEEIICLKKDEFIENFHNYIKKNKDNINNELFCDKIKDDNIKIKNNVQKFGLEKNYKFSIKKIYYKKISEMYKVSHLQISNAIEIMMTNGENHFIIFNLQQRDKIFQKILNYIGIETKNENQKKHLKTSSLFIINSSKSINKKNNNSFYMKYCPTNYLENYDKDNINLSKNIIENYKTQKKISKEINEYNKNKKYTKSLVEISSFIHEICDLWSKNKISNYDYLMLLNCLSDRSLNDLTQYYIFPWVLKNFDHNILNWFSSSLYRDLSLPLFACEQNLEELKTKYELQEENDKYHSGTFYSTSAFVCYFLSRQRPYSEIHLEIHGGQFDCPDRLFIGSNELSNISEKQQELIPALYNLAESYININNFNFGKLQKNQMEVKDFNLPNWSKEDPRKFILILRKILESEKVNKKLNLWIDLIFGYKQKGLEAIKNYNVYRKACYELTLSEIEEKRENNELQGYLYEKQELGYLPKQLFKKAHKKKEIYEEYKEKKNIFFDNSLKLMKMNIEQILNQNYEKNKTKIKFKKVKDIFIFYTTYILEDHLNYNYKGGISSLRSIMTSLSEINKSNHHIKKNPKKIKEKLNDIENKKNNFIILGENCQFIGKDINNIIKFNKKYIQIFDIKNNLYSCYYLNEISNISCLTTNEKGNRIYIGYENGNIIEYKIINDPKTNQNIIYPFMFFIEINKELLLNENIFNLNIFYNNDNNNNIKHNPNNYNTIVLQKIIENNFTLNNPHFPEEISCLKLNEEHNILIALTIKNLIYIISTNNKFKIMHIIDYLYEYPMKIKDIITLSFNGDFIVYTSLNVFLFNINGVPLCELNLLNKENNNITKIEYVVACFIYDVTLFTAHEDGSIIIWKIKNKNIFDNYNERISYVFNNNNSKCFLNEYNYNYDLYFYRNNINDFSEKKVINDYELKRKFDIVSQIKINENIKSSAIFMKMSKDMNYMIILDNKMNIYLLSDFDNYNINNNNESKLNKKQKNHSCIWCKRLINNECFRTTHIISISNLELNDFINEDNTEMRNSTDDKNKNIKIDNNYSHHNKEGSFLCEECKQKLTHTENYLYNY